MNYRRNYFLLTMLADGKESWIPFDSTQVSGSLHRATTHISKNMGDCMVCRKPISKGQLYVKPFILYAGPVHADCHHYPCYLAVRVRPRTFLLRSAAVYVKKFDKAPSER